MATITVVQLVYGTLALSSSTFINTTDAVTIVIRYILSTGLARIVLMFEIYGLQSAVTETNLTTEPTGQIQRVVLGKQEPKLGSLK